MSWQAWSTLAITALMIAAMVRNLAGPDLILLGGTSVLLALGIITPREAFSGFSNEGTMTVAVLYVVAAGVQQTGALDLVLGRVLGRPKSLAAAQLRLMLPVAGFSAFLNNTPIVAMMVPVVGDWCRRIQHSPSKLLMPLSYAAIVGGSCTLIGSATNLVVYGLAREHDPDLHIGLFEVGMLGVPAMVATLIYVLLASRWLLPARAETGTTILENAREYVVPMRVQPGSPIVGKSIEDAGLRHLPGLFLIEIERAEGEIVAAPGPDTRLRADDRLLFTGVIESVVDLQKIRGLVPGEDSVNKLAEARPNRRLVEAVVAGESSLLGKNVREAQFRTRYNAAIIAVHRQGQRVDKKIGDIELRAGDTLLLETHPSFIASFRDDPTFALVSEVANSKPRRHEQAWLALSLLALMVALSAFGVMPMVVAALLVSGFMMLSGCLTIDDARNSVDVRVLLTIAAAFGVGSALDSTGAAATLAHRVADLAMPLGPIGLLAAIYVTTVLLSSVVTTKAAAVLMFPIAAATASTAGMDFRPFVFVLMLGASANFMTPIGYQTNLMVYGPGRYRFGDFTRFGLPLQILLAVVTVTAANYVWL